jgi:hypothetical protein
MMREIVGTSRVSAKRGLADSNWFRSVDSACDRLSAVFSRTVPGREPVILLRVRRSYLLMKL